MRWGTSRRSWMRESHGAELEEAFAARSAIDDGHLARERCRPLRRDRR
jgi:hypothetical protein